MTFSTLASPGVSLQGGGGSGGGGGGTPGGSNTQIQYNSSGTFAGASGLTTTTGTELTIASGTKTADAPVLNMSQTWNNAAVTFTGLKFNATDTASAAASLLMDLQVGGSSRFQVRKNGSTTVGGTGLFRPGAGGYIGDGGAQGILLQDSTLANSVYLGATANGRLRLGAADAAAPVAQTLSVQSVVTGTTNTAGANLTITGSQGTGTGAGGSIIFQVAPAGSSGTAQNALQNTFILPGAAGEARLVNPVGGSGTLTLASSGNNNVVLNFRHSTGSDGAGGTDVGYVGRVSGALGIFTSSGSLIVGAPSGTTNSVGIGGTDVILARDTANTLALRNGANAQESRIYGTFTDTSNYRRVASGMSTAGVGFIRPEGAGTGASGNVIHISGLPTSNPGPGILWNNAGTPAIGT